MKQQLLRFSKLYLFLSILFLTSNTCFSATKTSVASGSWNVTATWGGSIPTVCDQIVIASNHTVTITGAVPKILTMIIQTGAVLNSGNYIIDFGNQPSGGFCSYTNYGMHNSSPGGKIRFGATFSTCWLDFDGNGTINCDIEYTGTSYGPATFLSGSTLTVNGNIYVLEYDLLNDGTITLTGDISTTSPLGSTNIKIANGLTGIINQTGNLILDDWGWMENSGTFNISGNVSMIYGLSGNIPLVSNRGTLIIGGDVLGSGLGLSFFLQDVNAVAKFGGQVFPVGNDGELCTAGASAYAGSAEPNTIEYNGGANQIIKTPFDGSSIGFSFLSNTYSNLILSNYSVKVMESNLTINGNLIIKDTAQLDTKDAVLTSVFDITLKGNWYDSSTVSDPFLERTGTVTFSGDSAQVIIADPVKKETFYNLVISDTGVVQNKLQVMLMDSITVSNNISLVSGVMDLNQNTLTLTNPNTTAIIGGSDTAYIQSEDLSGNNLSRVQWNVTGQQGIYTIPFGVKESGNDYYIPFSFDKTTAGTESGIGNISISTYSTSITNTPLPIYPDSVTQAYNPLNAVDRFWQIDVMGYTVNPVADLTFTFPDPEKPSSDTLVAQRWNTSTKLWDVPASAQTYTASTTYTTTGAVTISSVNTFSPWTLAKKTDYLKCPEILVPTNQTICYGIAQILSVDADTSGFYSSYTWSPATGLNFTTGDVVNADLQPSTITYTIFGTDGAGCYNSNTVTIEVKPTPTLSGTQSVNVCYGTDAVLAVSGGNSYNWSPGFYLNSTTNGSVTFSQAPAGTFVYGVTGLGEADCASVLTLTVTVNALPTVDAGLDQIICIGDSALLTAVGNVGSYSWSPNLYFINNSGVSATAGFPAAAGTYSCSVALLDINGCAASDGLVVSVVAALTANAGQDVIMPCGDSVALNGSGGISFAWTPAMGLSATNINSTVLNLLVPGIYTYSLTVASGMGCVSAPDKVIITVDSIQANAGEDQSICSGSTVNLFGTGGNVFSWFPAAGLSDTTTGNTTFSLSPPGTYTYTLTVSNGTGCTSGPDEIIITVLPVPTLNVVTDVSIVIGESVQLSASAGTDYNWTPISTLDDANIQFPTASPKETTTYVVTINKFGCTGSETVRVFVDTACSAVFIPNAFSPDGDGTNDSVWIQGKCVASSVLQIYDRWGNKVFQSYNGEEVWDGKYQETPLGAAVFFYYVNATLITGRTFVESGNITLVR